MDYIGVDIGGSFIKAAVLRPGSGPLKIAYRRGVPFPDFVSSSTTRLRVVSMREICDLVRNLIEDLLNPYFGPVDPRIAFTGQMGGMRDGKWWVTWQDYRCGVDDSNRCILAEEVAKEIGVEPLFPPVGDHQCTLYGAGLMADELSINIGTGSQVSVISNEVGTNWQSRPYFGGVHLATITHLPAGRALNGILRLIKECTGLSDEGAWDFVAEKVKYKTKADLRWNLRFWPSEKDTDGGSLLGIMEDSLDVGNLFISAFQEMARLYFINTGKISGLRRPILLTGGLAHRMPKLRECIIKQFEGVHVRVPSDPDETLTGLLELAKTHSDKHMITSQGGSK